jgi:hypothetical protein
LKAGLSIQNQCSGKWRPIEVVEGCLEEAVERTGNTADDPAEIGCPTMPLAS